jgi:uncharacterized RDD family membrane protein YckC
VLDIVRQIETPEGVELSLETAGLHVRAVAWLCDTLLRGVVYVAFVFVGSMLAPRLAIGPFLLLLFFGEWLYPTVFELLWNGQTPGKRLCGVRVVADDGTPVGPGASAVRNLLRAVDFFPFAYGLGIATMLIAPDFKRLGDLAAGTVVVHAPRRAARVTQRLDGEPVLPPFPLLPAEQQAVVEFAERARRWSKARRVELAELLPELGARGDAAVERVCGMARWLAEER